LSQNVVKGGHPCPGPHHGHNPSLKLKSGG